MIAHAQDSYMLERFAQHVPGSVSHERLDHSALSGARAAAQTFQSGITFPQEAALEPKMITNKLCAYLQDQPNITLKKRIAIFRYDRVIDCRAWPRSDHLVAERERGTACRKPGFSQRYRYPHHASTLSALCCAAHWQPLHDWRNAN